MFASAGSAVPYHSLGDWSLLFARQPEPDLDFEEDLVEDTQQLGGPSPHPGKPPKRRRTSPLVWVLLIALIGGGGYFAMDPDGAMNVINSLTGEAPAPVVQAPQRPRPVPAAPPSAQAPADPTPSTPGPPAGTLPTIPAPSSAPASPPAPSAPLAMKPAAPLFGEGQRVTISSLGSMTLSQDALGRLPGPSVKPGAILVVLDGELQPSGWVYNVRTETGAKGWVPEKQLRLVP